VAFSARHTVLERSTEVGFFLILSIYKQVYISIKDLHAGYAATRWLEKFAVKFAKTADLDWSKSHE